MKNLNKKLYSVIIACLLMLCFSVAAMATDVTDSSNETVSSAVSEPSSKEEPAQTSSNNEVISSETESEVPSQSSSEVPSSSGSSDNSVTSVESVETDSSVTEVSSENQDQTVTSSVSEASSSTVTVSSSTTTSATTTSVKVSSVQSKKESSSSKNTTSKKTYSNIGGVVVDEPDTSEWGNSEEADSSNNETSKETSSLESESDNHKRTDKNITDFTSLFWILIWIPVLLILASVGALVYVNRKAFLQEDDLSFDDAIESAPAKKKISATEKAKRKNNHKNRTNVYKPRD